MTSNHPALISLSINRRLMTETDRKMKNISITRTSIATVIAGRYEFNTPMGLESIISGEDQAQRVKPRIRNTTVRIIVIIEERIKSRLSGVSSLTVFTPTLKPEKPMFHT